MSQYNMGLLALADRARASESYAALEQCRAELFGFVEQIVAAGQAGKISTSDLALFNKVYDTVEEAITLRRRKLEGATFNFGRPKQSVESCSSQEKREGRDVL